MRTIDAWCHLRDEWRQFGLTGDETLFARRYMGICGSITVLHAKGLISREQADEMRSTLRDNLPGRSRLDTGHYWHTDQQGGADRAEWIEKTILTKVIE